MTTQSPVLRAVPPTRPQTSPATARRAARRGRPWAVFVVVVVVAFFGLTYSRISLDRTALSLDSLEDQIAQEEARNSELRLEVAELRDPQRIAEAAGKLGLVFPAERVELAVGLVDDAPGDTEYRWAQLRQLLSAQP